MSAGFEVVQAKIHGWVSPSRHGVYGIYFELYPRVVQKKCRCWRKRSKNHVSEIKCTSDVVDESSEIVYKKQEDGIFTPLGTFVGSALRAKKGEDVILVMDLFRIPLDGDAYYSPEISKGMKTGVKVASLSGTFQLGNWGDVTLSLPVGYPVPAMMQECAIDISEFKALLELRPVSSRPFMLANAKPRNEIFNVEAWLQGSTSPNLARKAPSSGGRYYRLSRQGHFNAWSNEGTSSQSNLLSWGRRSNSTIGTDRYTEKCTGATSIANFRNSKKDHVGRFCLTWVPDNWSKLWPGIWPEQEDNLMGKHDIVPLMEAEFRRDCVVFYNTLFPRSRLSSFLAVRDAVLDTSSKMSFKPLTPKLAQQVKSIIDITRGCLQVQDVSLYSSLAMMLRSSTKQSLEFSGGSSQTECSHQRSDDDLKETETESSGSFTLTALGIAGRDSPLSSIKATSHCELQAPRDLPPRMSSLKESNGRPSDLSNGHSENSATASASKEETAVLIESDTAPQIRASVKRLKTRSETLSSHKLADPSKYSSTGSANCPSQSISTRSHMTAAANAARNQHVGIMRGLSTPNGIFLDEYSPRIALLKRLFICFAHCGVHYSEVVDSSEIGDPWPYPLASVLGHGCRILIRLEDIEGSEFVNFLLTGDPSATDWKAEGVPLPLKPRTAATHAVCIETETGRLFEKRLRVASATDVGQTLMDGMKKKHLGLDLPIGGVGNPSPLGGRNTIGFRGDICCLGLEEPKESQTITEKVSHFAIRGLTRRGSTDTAPDRSPKWKSEEDIAKSTSMLAEKCKCVPDMQGGHLYIRIDDFGKQIGSSSWAERDHENPEEQEVRKVLMEKATLDKLSMRMIGLVRRVRKSNNAAGEILFSRTFEHLCKSESRQQGRDSVGTMTLLRVCSEPSLAKDEEPGTEKDNDWVRWVMFTALYREPLDPPPSAKALKMLFAHYDSQSAELYGTAHFKSFDDLFTELFEKKSYLIKHGQGIRRLVQPTIVQLCYKQLVLILRYELPQGRESAVEKNSFIATRTRLTKDTEGFSEGWLEAARRAISEELNITTESEQQELFGELSHGKDDKYNQEKPFHEKTISEKTTSPSYPGLLCEYKTHMVHFQIQEKKVHVWQRLGLLQIPSMDSARKSTDAIRFGCDFMTEKNTPGGKKRLYWQWIPRTEAQQMQKFLNMSEDTLDERWAKYAFQAQGLVRYPPSERALEILCRRCGIDIEKFGTGSYKPLRDFWLELTNEESYLQMCSGRPVRVAEALFVKVRWRPVADDRDEDDVKTTKVLVQVSEQKADGKTKDQKKLLSTRKGKSETWEDSAIRCVVQDLCVSKSQLKNMLAHKTSAASGYLFYEEKLKETVSYPGIQGSYRTHLVTFTLKENFQIFVQTTQTGRLNKMHSTTSFPSLAKVGRSTPESSEITEVILCDNYQWKTKRTTSIGIKSMAFDWFLEKDLDDVKGSDLWKIATERQEQCRVSSVLLGLEGSGPQKKSPFGGVHDTSGKPKPISAVGNHKWSAFRINNALQVPSDENGMRMRITRQCFYKLRRICKKIDLIDPVNDLLGNPQQSHDREQLNQMFAEREFFKHILSSNAVQAKEVLRYMIEYRGSRPTLTQRASHAVAGPPRKEAHHIPL